MERNDERFKPEIEGAFTKLKRDLEEYNIILTRKQLRKIVKMVRKHLKDNENQYQD